MSKPAWLERFRWFLPAVVFGLALALRLAVSGWGLPNDLHNQSYHPDEPIVWIFSQEVEPAKLKFTPGFYNYGTLYLTVLRVGSDVAKTYAGLGEPKSTDEYWRLMALGHRVGRVLSAFAGAGTVLVVFLMLRRRFGDLGALAGSVAIAFAPGHLVHSGFQTVDATATFLFALGLFYAVRVLDADEGLVLRFTLLSALFFGLSAATKYTGIIGLASLFVALFLSQRRRFLQLGALGGGVSVAALLAGTPGILLDFEKFKAGLAYEMAHTATAHGLIFEGVPGGFVYHLGNLAVGLTPLIMIFGLTGVAVACLAKDRTMIVLAIGALLLYFVLGRAQVSFLRYTLPLYPLFAAGLAHLVWLGHSREGMQKAWVAAVIVSLGIQLQGGSLRYLTWMMGEDPRDSVARWMKSVSNDQTIVGLASDPWFYTPPFFKDTAMPRTVPDNLLFQAREASVAPKVLVGLPPGQARGAAWNSALFAARPDYIVFSSFEAEDLLRLQRLQNLRPEIKAQVDAFESFVQILERDYKLQSGGMAGDWKTAHRPIVHDMAYVRPVIWIWKRADLP